MTGARAWMGAVAVSAALFGCDDVTPQGYLELVEGARSCTDDAECVLAGAGPCTCAAPIHQSARDEVEAAAADLDCEHVTTTMCPTNENLRCEAARCVTDDNP